MQLINQSTGRLVASQVGLAKTFWQRLKGLLGKKELPPGHGLAITPCYSIHTCFMRFPIDVVFLNKHGKVLHLIEHMTPWHFSPIIWNAVTVIELPFGSLQSSLLKPGDVLIFQK
ncbi:protein of unknown function DUF192 [Desulforamulus reducens MI-1]|uniref:DUF192 domain-containing protein n=1 Tax=Desulforamulus reducens (strain ATCC BAA-1160 / DSM 100696 / MI-1) TaxID=349161 RepID=A4J6D3_DESRM|nr:DUF192 domain-containing protein [Desulforamulus reducens]ABO50636.1 protein of unknown function DUF192 [Desulforamulus reducens MI-1]